jgi:hypothetical protein
MSAGSISPESLSCAGICSALLAIDGGLQMAKGSAGCVAKELEGLTLFFSISHNRSLRRLQLEEFDAIEVHLV